MCVLQMKDFKKIILTNKIDYYYFTGLSDIAS